MRSELDANASSWDYDTSTLFGCRISSWSKLASLFLRLRYSMPHLTSIVRAPLLRSLAVVVLMLALFAAPLSITGVCGSL